MLFKKKVVPAPRIGYFIIEILYFFTIFIRTFLEHLYRYAFNMYYMYIIISIRSIQILIIISYKINLFLFNYFLESADTYWKNYYLKTIKNNVG